MNHLCFFLVLCIVFSSINGLTYNLQKILDIINRSGSKFGNMNLFLDKKDSYFTMDLSDPNSHIEIEMSAATANTIIDPSVLYLCPFDLANSLKDCPIKTSETIFNNTTSHQHWKMNISHEMLITFFNNKETVPYIKMIISGQIRPDLHQYFNLAKDPIIIRPLPLMPIFIKNKKVYDNMFDKNHFKLCEDSPYEYISPRETSLGNEDCSRMNKKISSGRLVIYTANELGEVIDDKAALCYREIQTVQQSCSDDLARTTNTFSPLQRIPVSHDTCIEWFKEKKCGNDELSIAASETEYRTNFTMEQVLENITMQHGPVFPCTTQRSFSGTLTNCVLQTDIPMTYSFPFKSFETPFGHIPLKEHNRGNYMLKDTGRIIWFSRLKDYARNRPCLFTRAKEIPVTIYSNSIQSSSSSDKKFILKFVPKTGLPYTVDESQLLNVNDLILLNNDKCLLNPNVANSFLLNSKTLIQYVDQRFLNENHPMPEVYHKILPVIPIDNLFGIKQASSKDYQDSICGDISGSIIEHTKQFVDSYDYIWQCINGISTLVGTPTDFTWQQTNNNNNNSSEIETAPLPLVYSEKHDNDDDDDKESSLYSFVHKNLCLLHQNLDKIRDTVGQSLPNIFEDILPNVSPIHLGAYGDYHGIHRCQLVDWRSIKILPSLKVSDNLLKNPLYYQSYGGKRTDLCYIYPLVSINNETNIAQLLPGHRLSKQMNQIQSCNVNMAKKIFVIGDRSYIFENNILISNFSYKSESKNVDKSFWYPHHHHYEIMNMKSSSSSPLTSNENHDVNLKLNGITASLSKFGLLLPYALSAKELEEIQDRVHRSDQLSLQKYTNANHQTIFKETTNALKNMLNSNFLWLLLYFNLIMTISLVPILIYCAIIRCTERGKKKKGKFIASEGSAMRAITEPKYKTELKVN